MSSSLQKQLGAATYQALAHLQTNARLAGPALNQQRSFA